MAGVRASTHEALLLLRRPPGGKNDANHPITTIRLLLFPEDYNVFQRFYHLLDPSQ